MSGFKIFDASMSARLITDTKQKQAISDKYDLELEVVEKIEILDDHPQPHQAATFSCCTCVGGAGCVCYTTGCRTGGCR